MKRLLENPSPEHEEMREILRTWAKKEFSYKSLGSDSISTEDGRIEPDVVLFRELGKASFELFIGDAKWSERANDPDSKKRLLRYFKIFQGFLTSGLIDGGTLAVITDTRKKAKAWVPELNEIAEEAGIIGSRGGKPNFQVVEYRKSWIAWW